MSQVNVNPSDRYEGDRPRSGTGMAIGLMLGLVLLALLAWFAFSQSGIIGGTGAGSNTDVSVTTNNPAGGTGRAGGTGSTGGSGSATGSSGTTGGVPGGSGSTSGGTTGSTGSTGTTGGITGGTGSATGGTGTGR